MSKFYTVTSPYEGGGVLRINGDHIVAIKKRTGGGYRVWLSHEMQVGDEPDQTMKNAGNQGPLTAKVLNVGSTELDALFAPPPATKS